MEILGMSIGFTVTVALVLLAIWFVKGDKPESLTDLGDQLAQAERLVEIAVAGAQQRADSGQIPREERYAEVESFLLNTFPDLQPHQARLIIESAVYWFKRGRQFIAQRTEESDVVELVEEADGTLKLDTSGGSGVLLRAHTPRPTGA